MNVKSGNTQQHTDALICTQSFIYQMKYTNTHRHTYLDSLTASNNNIYYNLISPFFYILIALLIC